MRPGSVVTRTIVAFSALLLAARQPSRPPVADEPFAFMQMADPQFGFFTANQDFARETANFQRAIAAANRLRPAFVVVCGDLTHRAGDPAQIAEYLRIVSQLDRSIPLYSVPGNHDLALPLSPASIAAYRQTIGPDRYTFENHGVFGVVINSSLVKDPDSAPDEAVEQDAWLRAVLAQARRDGRESIMVFQHHSWFLTQADEPDQYYNLPLATRGDLLNLLKQSGVSHVFAGHYHRNAVGRDGTLEMVTTGPVGRPLGDDPSGVRIVTVRGRTVTHQYYSLDSIPERLTLAR